MLTEILAWCFNNNCFILQSRSEEDWRPESSQTEVLKLKEQLATLTNSLATVSEEKTRMEGNYQADKKKLRV